MSRPSCTALLTLSILILSNDLSAERPIDSDLARKITTVIDAKAIERVPPKYPINEATFCFCLPCLLYAKLFTGTDFLGFKY